MSSRCCKEQCCRNQFRKSSLRVLCISKKGFRPGPAGSRGDLNFCPGVAGPNFSRFFKPRMSQIGWILSEIWLFKVIFWKTPKLVEIFTIFADSWRALAPEFRWKIVNNPLSFVFFWQITLYSYISLNIHPIWLIFGLKKRAKLGPATPGQKLRFPRLPGDPGRKPFLLM